MRRLTSIIGACVLGLLGYVPIGSADDIVFMGPMTGTASIIGAKMSKGSQSEILDSGCDAQKAGAATQEALLGGAKIIIGLPCVEALDAASNIVSQSERDVAIMTLGVQVGDITNRNEGRSSNVFRLAPRANQEANAAAAYIKANWRGMNFAIIDDGTLYGRQLAQDVRFQLEEDNLTPVFTDNYRPLLERQAGLVRRIAKSGATHVFIGGDAYDAAIIGKDAAALNIDLTFAGGSALKAPPDDGILPDGTVFSALRPLEVERDGDTYQNYAALTLLADDMAQKTLDHASDTEVTISEALRTLSFQTPIGTLRFDDNGENDLDWFTIYQVRDGALIEIGATN